jgi:phosphotransferase system enzyme I (PtsI)
LPAVTRDGHQVRLLANIGFVEEIPLAMDRQVDGIGLYRTEFMYLDRDSPPDEEDHYREAGRVLQACGDLRVTFRTCDLGSDKLPAPLGGAHEPNPAMGLRAIRRGLGTGALMHQLRGLMRASRGRELSLMFPMISSVAELKQVRQAVLVCASELAIDPASLKLGVLVETPAAALVAEHLAAQTDFLAIGTNDLIQYALAVDRLNERVSHLYSPLHPAVLRLIREVVRAGQRTGVPVSLCGEMAGEPEFTLLLLGMGIRALSMNVLAVPLIRRIVRAAIVSEAEALAQRVLELGTAEEVTEQVRATTARLFPTGLSVVPTIAHGATAVDSPTGPLEQA